MKKANVLLALSVLCATATPAFAQALSHEQELNCLSLLYLRNVFGDEKQKRPTEGGWSEPTPGEAVTPFEPGEYLPKVQRIESAAEAGNRYASFVLGELYDSGQCGLPEDEDLTKEFLDEARAYEGISQAIIMQGAKRGMTKETLERAYWWLKVAMLRYPYVSKQDARRVFADKGNAEPSDEQIQGFISSLQPPKEVLEQRLHRLSESARDIREPFTPAELAELDQQARTWVAQHP